MVGVGNRRRHGPGILSLRFIVVPVFFPLGSKDFQTQWSLQDMTTQRPFDELNLWQRIYAEHWDEFADQYRQAHDGFIPEHWEENVHKMLGCGDIAEGYYEYKCADCGTAKKVGFTCKSRLCLRCYKVAVDNWLKTSRNVLFEGVIHRQVVLTVPTEIRVLILSKSAFLKVFIDAAAKAVKELVETWRPKKRIRPGIMAVLQIHGRAGNPNPHVHLVVSEGGIDKDGQWQHCHYFDTKKLRKKWQFHVITELQKTIKGTAYAAEWKDKLGKMFHEYPTGFDVNAMPEKGPVERLVVYLCKYVSSPPISIRRIEAYDGKDVTYRYEDHRRGLVSETLPATEFIGRMIQHLPEKGFRMVRYYGIYARSIRNKMHDLVADRLERLDRNMEKVAGFFAQKRGLTPEQYRAELESKFGDHRVRCPACGSENMRLVAIWSRTAGFIFGGDMDCGPPDTSGWNLAEQVETQAVV